MVDFAQFLVSGLTVGAVYALAALGFTLIYNASDVVNFAQGEFVMLGGMVTVSGIQAGLPMFQAAALAVAITIVVGLALHGGVIAPAKRANPVTLIILTIGASLVIRGIAALAFGKQFRALKGFSGDEPLLIAGVAVLPQMLWVLGGSTLIVIALWLFLSHTLFGKAILATAANRMAAQLQGINTGFVTFFSFGASAAVGALAGILVTPITLTSYDVGTLLALKGFSAAVLGGIGNPIGAVVGGLVIGLLEALCAGYVSSTYKDAAAFIAIILVLFVMPQGLLGRRSVERV
ncbi:branched-chain amino acid ABC transporter permease [Ferrovibrio sp.]|uniref:branched-chain amino acid ABC transporter permease n=1 Tax=Ferrovibrio sp. TaxID=1917215 RepID=UPI00311EE0AF